MGEIVAKSGEASNHSELLVGHHHCIQLLDGAAAAAAVVPDSCQFNQQLGTVGLAAVLEQSMTSISRISEKTGSNHVQP